MELWRELLIDAQAKREMGDILGALVCIAPLRQRWPVDPQVLRLLSGELRQCGVMDEAVSVIEQALKITVHEDARLWNSAGVTYLMSGDQSRAEVAFRAALSIAPDMSSAQRNLGIILADRQLDEALTLLYAASRDGAGDVQASITIASILREQGLPSQSLSAAQSALVHHDREAALWHNLGLSLSCLGAHFESDQALLRAKALGFDLAGPESNRLYNQLYFLPEGPEGIFKNHRAWAREGLKPIPYQAHSKRRERLRVALLSPDLRQHSVSYFVEPLLSAAPRKRVEFICLSDLKGEPDQVTQRLRDLAEVWVEVGAQSDVELRRLILSLELDVLVELAGHTAHNRLSMLRGGRVAPIQVSWLGYPATTGLQSIDARLVDVFTDPPHADAWHSESLVRLPPPFLCYQPPSVSPDPTPPPCQATGTFTLGSFNNITKVSDHCVELWSRVLCAIPIARLVIKSSGLKDLEDQRVHRARFARFGVETRVEFLPKTQGITEHLELYGMIDLCVDTFPYHGTTTTCEALFMGVPVLSLIGDAHVSRVGLSLLSALGLEDFICHSDEEFINRAVYWADSEQWSRLSDLRRAQRAHLSRSQLCDAEAFADKFCSALTTLHETARLRENTLQ